MFLLAITAAHAGETCPPHLQASGDGCATPECPPGQLWTGSECRIMAPVVRGTAKVGSQHDIPVVEVPGGDFPMGSTEYFGSEKPVHVVTLSPFVMMQHEVTQAMYQKVVGTNPSQFSDCPTCPVEQVFWTDAVSFANALSAAHGLKPAYAISPDGIVKWDRGADGWRLPTEAEWEYAARGGEITTWSGSMSANEVGWFDEQRTHPVCKKKRNGFGLCDMSGNVAEWVWDYFGPYDAVAVTDPAGPDTGKYRTNRGSSWRHGQRYSPVPVRAQASVKYRGKELGFRLVRSSERADP